MSSPFSIDDSDHDVAMASVYARVPRDTISSSRTSRPTAEVIVNLTAPFPSWRWLKLQLLGINWATLGLVVAVLAVSRHINSQLDDLKRLSGESAARYTDLEGKLHDAEGVVAQLKSMHTDLAIYNTSLYEAKAAGLDNLTAKVAAFNATLWAGGVDFVPDLACSQGTAARINYKFRSARYFRVGRSVTLWMQMEGYVQNGPLCSNAYQLVTLPVPADVTNNSWYGNMQVALVGSTNYANNPAALTIMSQSEGPGAAGQMEISFVATQSGSNPTPPPTITDFFFFIGQITYLAAV